MKTWKKILITIITILLLLMIGGSFYAGNFFVDYALVRPEGGAAASTQDNSSPQNVANPIIDVNVAKEQAAYDDWIIDVAKKDVSIQSDDGLTLRGSQYDTNPNSHKWALLVHGYQANSEDMRFEARNFSLNGYNAITPNMRASGESDGTYIGMGWLDRLDVLKWTDFIIAQDKDAEIVLYGESMGGATVTMTSGEQLPSNVKAIIEDCGYTSVYEMFENQLDYRFGLPEFPFMYTARIIANIRAGYDIKEASALEQVKKASVPMLFIHGSEDTYVPTEMVYELYEACPSEKELYVVEGAGHGASTDINPEAYYDKVFNFLNKHLKFITTS